MSYFGTPTTSATPSFGTPSGDNKNANKLFGTPTAQPTLGGFGSKPSTPTAGAFMLGNASPFSSTTQAPATAATAGFGFSSTPTAAATTSTSTGFSLGGTPSTGIAASATTGTLGSSFSFGATPTATTAPIPLGGTGFGLLGTPTASTGFSLTGTPTTAAATTAAGFSLLTPASTPAATLGLGLSSTTATTTTSFSLGGNITVSTTSSALGALSSLATSKPAPSFFATPATSSSSFALGITPTSTIVTSTATSAIPPTGTLTFAQLEDGINKWTIDLEEQGKLFGNQAKQLNAWDRLLISNGEKVSSLNSGMERVKQQQQQLDQELDFILAQQKELEDLITPLEKELNDIPVTDLDRNHTYQLAENMDTQLKQMSEDLKEIIEQLNESNKTQELSNPITQIGKILNAHMNSLQWVDRNTAKITTHLDQISKMHDLNRRSHEQNLQRTYD